jgi:hypothetical protein
MSLYGRASTRRRRIIKRDVDALRCSAAPRLRRDLACVAVFYTLHSPCFKTTHLVVLTVEIVAFLKA